ncbi:hypothetical protein CHN51_03305 [Sphingorhabdus sp. YGSMI21]|nr:hypothetical protein CHN51_03305 [Sphingorhabdus sp. YGSMI21]
MLLKAIWVEFYHAKTLGREETGDWGSEDECFYTCPKDVIASAAWQTRAARADDWGETLWIAASLRSSQ